MSADCQAALDGVGAGVSASLRAVDCVANDVTAQAFGRLFAPGGAMGPVLSIVLAIFIALFAIGLMLGRTNIGIRSVMPRMITLGLVLTFATSWAAYQSVVWNLAIGAPDWIAGLLTGVQGSSTQVFGDKIDVVLLSIQQATENQGTDISAFSPPGMLWLGAMLFLLGTVGVLVTAKIGLAVLVALGPVFVVMALFPATRGLFTGWLKGVVMLALTPLFAVLAGGVMLEISVPLLQRLNATPGEIDPQAAMAFLLIGSVHIALMVLVLKTSATMVGGWRVFGLVPEKGAASETPLTAPSMQAGSIAVPLTTNPQTQQQSPAPRRAVVTGATAPSVPAANDTGGSAQVAQGRTTVINTTENGAQLSPLSKRTSRAKGIGSRFRAAPHARTEKLK